MDRSFNVIEGRKQGLEVLDYTIVIKQKGKKQKVQVTKKLTGYKTYGIETADIEELKEHFDAGKRLESFVKDCDGLHLTKKQKLEQPSSQEMIIVKHVTGNALSRRTKGLKIKYKMYSNLMEGRDDRLDYKAFSCMFMGCVSEQERYRCLRVMLRSCSMNPREKSRSFVEAVSLSNSEKLADAIREQFRYFLKRIDVLKNKISSHEREKKYLSGLVFRSTTYELILRANVLFDEAKGGIIDLTEDEPIVSTLQNTSKAQLCRVNSQCVAVLYLFEQLLDRDRRELAYMVDAYNDLQIALKLSIESALQFIEGHILRRRQFNMDESMQIQANIVSDRLDQEIKAVTIRKYYNEYVKYGGFKEDERGLHRRQFFLEKFGFKKMFERYLKKEKRLTVDEAFRCLYP
jgi:hypothetical protein